MDAHTAEIIGLQEQFTAVRAKLSQLSANHSEHSDELSYVEMQNAAEATVLADL